MPLRRTTISMGVILTVAALSLHRTPVVVAQDLPSGNALRLAQGDLDAMRFCGRVAERAFLLRRLSRHLADGCAQRPRAPVCASMLTMFVSHWRASVARLFTAQSAYLPLVASSRDAALTLIAAHVELERAALLRDPSSRLQLLHRLNLIP